MKTYKLHILFSAALLAFTAVGCTSDSAGAPSGAPSEGQARPSVAEVRAALQSDIDAAEIDPALQAQVPDDLLGWVFDCYATGIQKSSDITDEELIELSKTASSESAEIQTKHAAVLSTLVNQCVADYEFANPRIPTERPLGSVEGGDPSGMTADEIQAEFDAVPGWAERPDLASYTQCLSSEFAISGLPDSAILTIIRGEGDIIDGVNLIVHDWISSDVQSYCAAETGTDLNF